MPAPSPHAKVEQRVGLTDFTVDYSSPGVKGRKIWGELVPYDKEWRAGANAPTKLTASRDFTFGGAPVKAGTYVVLMTPGKASWSVVLKTDAEPPAAKEVAKATVTPAALPASRERLVYLFSDTTDDKTALDLEWEKVRVRVPITVDTRTQVTAAIERATATVGRPHLLSASYYFNTGNAADLDKALTLIDRSIQINESWRNTWLKAQILGKKGKKAEATAAANRALALGKGDKIFEDNVKENVNKAIASWK